MISDLPSLLDELRKRTLVEHRHQNVELKQSWSQDVGKKISANANKIHLAAAWIVIGVTDSGDLCRHDERWAKATEELISGHINQYLEPIQACINLEPYVLNGAWILVLKVSNPGTVVYWNKKAYRSAGTTIAEMEPEETMELTVSLPGLRDYSKQPWNGKIDSQVVRQFVSRVSKRQSSSHLADLSNLEPEAALHRISLLNTNACRLLFGATPYRVIFYDAAEIPQRNETRYSLYSLLTNQFRTEVNQWASGYHQSNAPAYLPAAFQEGIANAVAHAAYFENDGELMVEVFHDHLCISNLCTRESSYFANRWFSRSHKTVNNLLMETLRLAGHVDELGRGKNLIFKEHIANGRAAPQVVIERTGRYSRWRLMLPGNLTNQRHLRLLDALRAHYRDEHKALIAVALVLWRNKPVKELRNYVDGESAPIFAEVLDDYRGATFFSETTDEIVLNRWARLLLSEGVDSKSLTPAEEDRLYDLICHIHSKYEDGIITPAGIRELAEFGNADGAKSLSSKVLKKWESEGKVQKVKRGVFKLRPRPEPVPKKLAADLFSNLEQGPTDPQVGASASTR